MEFTTLIDQATLRELLGDPKIALLDCRFDLMNLRYGRLAYLRGHIPGARYVDLNQDLSAAVTPSSGRHPLPAPEVFAATLDRLRISHATQVIAYDEANGSFAARAWWMLRWVGHRSAAVLDGGLQAWIAGGGALASGDENHPAYAQPGGGFLPRVDAAAVIGTREVEARLREGRPLIVDARAAERFSGSVEPIDAVAGHIAGAVNHPFTRNLAPDGKFLPAAQLRRLWEERLAGTAVHDVTVMCGSGVTACHDLLSLEIAGLKGARLYDGSWSEWIRDPGRAVARGA